MLSQYNFWLKITSRGIFASPSTPPPLPGGGFWLCPAEFPWLLQTISCNFTIAKMPSRKLNYKEAPWIFNSLPPPVILITSERGLLLDISPSGQTHVKIYTTNLSCACIQKFMLGHKNKPPFSRKAQNYVLRLSWSRVTCRQVRANQNEFSSWATSDSCVYKLTQKLMSE